MLWQPNSHVPKMEAIAPVFRTAFPSLHSLIAGLLAGTLAKHDTDTCVRMGLLAASLSLRSYEPVSPEISTSSVSQEQVKSRSWPKVKVWKMD